MARKYGLYIFIVVLWIFAQTSYQQPPPLPRAVRNYFADRESRYHHFLWHQIRNLWLRLDQDTREGISELGWEPPRPALRYNSAGRSVAIENNGAGEDFFYMHRQMIAEYNRIARRSGGSRVTGFRRIPTPTSRTYPVYPSYPGANEDLIRRYKSDDFYWEELRPLEDELRDPDYLTSVTLAQYGTRIEFTIHNWMHLRFSEEPIRFRATRGDNPAPDISTRYDDPRYDWLVDSYAAAVNPFFWPIHKWVDDRITDWMDANGVDEDEYEWYDWEGGPMENLSDLIEVNSRNLAQKAPKKSGTKKKSSVKRSSRKSSSRKVKKSRSFETMEKVYEILKKTGLESHFDDDVIFENDPEANV